MGFLQNLIGLVGSSVASGPPCPECGSALIPDDGGPDVITGRQRFECSNSACNDPVSFGESGGPPVSPFARTATSADPCESCQQPISRGDLTLPWEDGDNPNAYVTCPYCQHENIKYGYGED